MKKPLGKHKSLSFGGLSKRRVLGLADLMVMAGLLKMTQLPVVNGMVEISLACPQAPEKTPIEILRENIREEWPW